MRDPQRSTLFPYTTLFRSDRWRGRDAAEATCGFGSAVFGSRHHSEGLQTWPHHGNRKSRSEEHTSELQSQFHLVCRLLLEKKKHVTQHVQIGFDDALVPGG